jgi:hypothetical protein
MAIRKPLVIVGGRRVELPAGDTISWDAIGEKPAFDLLYAPLGHDHDDVYMPINGPIDGIVIGGTTPAAGTFTTLAINASVNNDLYPGRVCHIDGYVAIHDGGVNSARGISLYRNSVMVGQITSSGATMAIGGASVRLTDIADNNRFAVSATGCIVGAQALATSATAGFLWIPSCAGAPTGAPTAPYTNAAALVADTTNSRLYVRIGSTWKYASLT